MNPNTPFNERFLKIQEKLNSIPLHHDTSKAHRIDTINSRVTAVEEKIQDIVKLKINLKIFGIVWSEDICLFIPGQLFQNYIVIILCAVVLNNFFQIYIILQGGLYSNIKYIIYQKIFNFLGKFKKLQLDQSGPIGHAIFGQEKFLLQNLKKKFEKVYQID